MRNSAVTLHIDLSGELHTGGMLFALNSHDTRYFKKANICFAAISGPTQRPGMKGSSSAYFILFVAVAGAFCLVPGIYFHDLIVVYVYYC